MRTRFNRQRGIALIAVTTVLAVASVTLAEYSNNTTIDYTSAANARDDMRAYFLTRSAMNLSRLVIEVQHDVLDKYRKYIGDVQLADFLPMLMGIFGGGKEEVAALTQAVGGIDTGAVKGLGLAAGQFDVRIESDDGKTNVNCANGSVGTQKNLETALTAMVAPKGYDLLFEERDGDGEFTDRATFIRAIIDYVDRDEAAYATNGQPEDYHYEGRTPPYKAKNNYIDSVAELRMVRGMDDRKWAIFGSAFTVYGGCKINISAVADLNVIVGLISFAAKNPQDPVLLDPQRLWTLAGTVAQARSIGIMFDDLNAFAEFVKDPLNPFEDPAGNGQSGGSPKAQVPGVELDVGKLGQVARAGGRRTYRVEATATIGRVQKKVVGLWDTETQNQNFRDAAYSRGAWLYWREE